MISEEVIDEIPTPEDFPEEEEGEDDDI